MANHDKSEEGVEYDDATVDPAADGTGTTAITTTATAITATTATTATTGNVMDSLEDDEFSYETDEEGDERIMMPTPRVVSQESATLLFLAIERSDWTQVHAECDSHPADASVWVQSSEWKRLPIHEACRRKPPVKVVAKLLDLCAEGACAKTHFGELPLHLAVGCGASLEVILLLMGAYPQGVEERDNGGRTPALSANTCIGETDDIHIISRILTRCSGALAKGNAEWESRMRKVHREHHVQLVSNTKEHTKAMAKKDDEISLLQTQCKQSKAAISDLSQQMDEYEVKVASKNSAERRLMEEIHKLEDDIAGLMSQNRSVRKTVQALEATKQENEATIQALQTQIGDLKGMVAQIVSEQDTIVSNQMHQAELDLRTMIESQRIFMRKVVGHRESVRTAARDISGMDMTMDPPPPSQPNNTTLISTPNANASPASKRATIPPKSAI
uniref:CCDC93 coiled-coil domain-containing protein n=1 Tax=Attheya septentrionalis TaxID=420275 RepID=A0A7S2UDH9_9STRA